MCRLGFAPNMSLQLYSFAISYHKFGSSCYELCLPIPPLHIIKRIDI
nr:MAG TPA: hypothetical protein [Siphoviridae sp. ctvzh6]DAP59154.1 MAG TPA: hypothetical protein [Caudoviricetes sp.]DAZ39641.1 MAG TPA: hypothetical protein [Caudoviricetes sp.]